MGPIWILPAFCLFLAATSVHGTKSIKPGTVLKVTSVLQAPFLMIRNAEPNKTLAGNDRYEGYIKSLLDEVASTAGFDYELTLAPENRYGSYEHHNKTWDGMVGELVSKRADLAAATLTVTANRAIDIDFSIPFMNSGPVILMRKPNRANISLLYRLLAPLDVFDKMVWLMILVSYLVTGFFLYLVSYFNPYEWRKLARDNLATYREAESFSCLNTYWFLLSALTWQGYVRAPRSLGGRVISGFWWVFVIFTVIHYIACLTNYLRATGYEPRVAPVTSFRDLAMTDYKQIAILKGGSTADYFKNSPNPVNQRIWNLIESHGEMVSSHSEGVELIRRRHGRLVYIGESLSAQHEARRAPCDLMHTSPNETPYFQAFGLQKDSEYRDAINIALLDLRHKGTLEMLSQRWIESEECLNTLVPQGARSGLTDQYGYIALSGARFTGMLLFLAIGIVAGCILTAVETCVFKIAEKGDEPSEETPSDAQAKKESDV